MCARYFGQRGIVLRVSALTLLDVSLGLMLAKICLSSTTRRPSCALLQD